MTKLAVKSISKSFGDVPVLRGISIDIADGELVSLVGPSGCGKSTLLRIIAGLESNDSGSIELDGNNVDQLRPHERNIAMVFQSYALYPTMTIRENIALPLMVRSLNPIARLPGIASIYPKARSIRRAVEIQVNEVAAALEISHLLERKPAQLSGGQQQRAALGRAMVRQPTAFLLDEPFSNLDAKLRAQLRGEVKKLHNRLGGTFVLVTHDQAEAMTLSDRIAVMHDGKILQLGQPETVYDDPENLTVAEFIGSPKINVFTAGIKDQSLVMDGKLIASDVQLPDTVHVQIANRPECLSLTADNNKSFSAIVTRVEPLGSETLVFASCANQNQQEIAIRISGRNKAKCKIGEKIGVKLDSSSLLIFGASGQRMRPTAGAMPKQRKTQFAVANEQFAVVGSM